MKRIVISIVTLMLIVPQVVTAQDEMASRREVLKFGTETEIAALLQALRGEENDSLDAEIVELADGTGNRAILTVVFGFFGEREKPQLERRALAALTDRLDEHADSVLAAIQYLGKIGSASALPVLGEVIDGEDRRFLASALRAFGRAAGRAGGSLADDAVTRLTEFDEGRNLDETTRRELIAALGDTGRAGAVGFLVEIAEDGGLNQFLRISAMEALSAVGDSGGLQAVLGGVSSAEPLVRAAAVGALAPFSGAVVDEAILLAFRDSHDPTRIAAAKASGERKLASAVPFLRFRATRDENQSVREQAIRALGQIGGSEATGIVKELFEDRLSPLRIRLVAAEVLLETGGGYFPDKLVEEMDEAKRRNSNAVYNGFLGILGKARSGGNLEAITRRLLGESGTTERNTALTMAVNNNLRNLAPEIRAIAEGSNESLARRARITLERMGL